MACVVASILAILIADAFVTSCRKSATVSPHVQNETAWLQNPSFAEHLDDTPPLYWISASSYHDAGLQHGRLARSRIQGWINSTEMQSLCAFAFGRGSGAFQQMRKANSEAFPGYAEELEGISEGSGVSLDNTWCATLINELSNLRSIESYALSASKKTIRECSDIFAVSANGYKDGFAHGHNEDWGHAIKPYLYFLAFALNSSLHRDHLDFEGCAGLVYPGSLNVGWSATWNVHGMWSTQNMLSPRVQYQAGLASAFIQRRALCRATDLDNAIGALSFPSWIGAASVNIVDYKAARMANVELWESRSSVVEVTAELGNYSHFNEFKRLTTYSGKAVDDPFAFLNDLRQTQVDALPAPRTAEDVVQRLGLVSRPDTTIASFVVDGSTGHLKVWCSGWSMLHNPTYTWDLDQFFKRQDGSSSSRMD
eukprot:TRINITY_DN42264_c0_g1_i1.p1 TRINITY_DN42264_c0_g1~~TRINITY_DN42264_c0_g1_i1.p1  ORF type:complete len:460 (-),score=76.55 TRINITY_DN42264_c0_g1_i1:31-1305(-)